MQCMRSDTLYVLYTSNFPDSRDDTAVLVVGKGEKLKTALLSTIDVYG